MSILFVMGTMRAQMKIIIWWTQGIWHVLLSFRLHLSTFTASTAAMIKFRKSYCISISTLWPNNHFQFHFCRQSSFKFSATHSIYLCPELEVGTYLHENKVSALSTASKKSQIENRKWMKLYKIIFRNIFSILQHTFVIQFAVEFACVTVFSYWMRGILAITHSNAYIRPYAKLYD